MSGQDKKTISSSMIELKAELYRKQEEFRHQRVASAGFVKAKKHEKSGKPSIWAQKNKGVTARAAADENSDGEEEEEDALIKSKRALEQKAKLYEKITSASEIPEEDGSGYFLVDFQKKAVDSIVSDREAQRKREEEEKEDEAERKALSEEVSDEGWVEFTDSLGRTRKCLQEDLDKLLVQDKRLAGAQLKEKKGLLSGPKMQSVPQEEEYRERQRHKWEEEAEAMMDQGQVHYANVQYDEIRTHGTGFFQFSKDHEKREDQMENLRKLREETKDEKSRKERIKDKRKNMMEARLAKVRQRRKLKAGETEPDSQEPVGSEMVSQEDRLKKEEHEKEKRKKKEEQEKEAEENRKAHLRDWDKGKITSIEMMHQNYLERQREVRDEEFAPPSIYEAAPHRSKARTVKPAGFSKAVPQGAAHVNDKARMERLQELTKQIPSASQPVNEPEKSSQRDHLETESISNIDLNSVPLPCDTKQNSHSQTQSHKTADFSHPTNNSNWQHNANQSHRSSFQTDHSTNQHIYHPSHQNVQQMWTSAQQSIPGNYNNQWTSGVGQQQPSQNGQQHPSQSSQQHPSQSGQQHQWTTDQHLPQSDQFHQWTPAGQLSFEADQHKWMSNQQATQNDYPYHDWTVPPQQTAESRCEFSYPQTSQWQGQNTVPSNPTSQTPQQPRSTQANPSSYGNDSQSVNTLKRKSSTVDRSHQQTAKKKVLPKTAVVDTRYVQNDTDDPDLAPIQVPTVQYTPGSFTAAKDASKEEYEQEVLESQLKDQISGGPHLYTAEEIEEQREREEEEEKEDMVQDFLDSLKGNN